MCLHFMLPIRVDNKLLSLVVVNFDMIPTKVAFKNWSTCFKHEKTVRS